MRCTARSISGAASGLMMAAIALVSGDATATSIMRAPAHNPLVACEAIQAAVAEITGKTARSDFWPLYFSDDHGWVDSAEFPDFVRAMTSAEGKADETPIRITTVWPVGKREAKDHKALYVVGLQRSKWYPDHEGMFDPMHIEPAGYQIDFSYWLVVFSGNRILEFREGPYNLSLVDYNKRLRGCGDE